MSTPITIEAIDDESAAWISEQAKRRGIAPESLVLEMIHKSIEAERNRSEAVFDDLDALAGGWDEEEAAEFLDAVRDFEQVDERLWQ